MVGSAQGGAPPPGVRPGERTERLAQALRANLRRRKAAAAEVDASARDLAAPDVPKEDDAPPR